MNPRPPSVEEDPGEHRRSIRWWRWLRPLGRYAGRRASLWRCCRRWRHTSDRARCGLRWSPRYHSGGIAGIRPGEVPAILQRGEMVLPSGSKAGGMNVKIFNTASNKVETTVKETPGKGIDVIVREIIATDINKRGTALNKAVQMQTLGSTATPPGMLRKV